MLLQNESSKSARGIKEKASKGKLIGALKKLDSKLLKFLQKNKSLLPTEERLQLEDNSRDNHSVSGLQNGILRKKQSKANLTLPDSQVSHQPNIPLQLQAKKHCLCNMKARLFQGQVLSGIPQIPCDACLAMNAVVPDVCHGLMANNFEHNLMVPKGLSRRKTLIESNKGTHQRTGSLGINKGHQRKSSQSIHIHQHVHCHHPSPISPNRPLQKSLHSVADQISQLRLTPPKPSIDSQSLRVWHRRLSSAIAHPVPSKPANACPPTWTWLPAQPTKETCLPQNSNFMMGDRGRKVAFVRLDLTQPLPRQTGGGPATGTPANRGVSRLREGRIACAHELQTSKCSHHKRNKVQEKQSSTSISRSRKGNHQMSTEATSKGRGNRDTKSISHQSEQVPLKTSLKKCHVTENTAIQKKRIKVKNQPNGQKSHSKLATHEISQQIDPSPYQVSQLPNQRQSQAYLYRDTDADCSDGENEYSEAVCEEYLEGPHESQHLSDVRASQEPLNTMRAIQAFSNTLRQGCTEAEQMCQQEQTSNRRAGCSTWSSGFNKVDQIGGFSKSQIGGSKDSSKHYTNSARNRDSDKENVCVNPVRPQCSAFKACYSTGTHLENNNRIDQFAHKHTRQLASGPLQPIEDPRHSLGQSPLVDLSECMNNAVTKRASSRKGSITQNGRHSFGLEPENLSYS